MPELLIVDDDEALRRWEERVVRGGGYSCEGACDASAGRERLRRDSYQLALLDVNMPGESGMELLSHIRRTHPEVAVVMVTGEDSTKLAMTATEQGAYGYLVKPVGSGELLINIANALHRGRCEAENRHLVRRLQATVGERGHELEQALKELAASEAKMSVSQSDTIFRLVRLVEFRDEDTGHHIHRMNCYCEILARELGFSEYHCELMRLSSQLHDVGKIAVPDNILLKPGKLTEEEFEVIKGHAEAGFRMLSGSPSEVMQLGALIAHTHHERWDGRGYPRGLDAEDIPPEGRVAAVADVFDALTSDRVYRAALPVRSAVEMMREASGHHFDPELLDAFFDVLPEIETIRQAYAN
ncbi:MAG: HD domain-containing phosphohydrolase [Solirubrobacteraceae bacterium]